MRIAQLVLPGASAYERKSQLLDLECGGHAAALVPLEQGGGMAAALRGFDLVHVYGPRDLPPALFINFKQPYVASGTVRKPRFAWRSPREPEYALSPVENDDFTLLPEAVDDAYFGPLAVGRSQLAEAPANDQLPTANIIIGSIQRPSITNFIDQTLARIHRFRDDITWHLFTHQPSPAELAQLSAWIDPAVEDDDFDGLTAEALVTGLPVVASRTPINVQRCEQGRTGFLIPPRDPNELVH